MCTIDFHQDFEKSKLDGEWDSSVRLREPAQVSQHYQGEHLHRRLESNVSITEGRKE